MKLLVVQFLPVPVISSLLCPNREPGYCGRVTRLCDGCPVFRIPFLQNVQKPNQPTVKWALGFLPESKAGGTSG